MSSVDATAISGRPKRFSMDAYTDWMKTPMSEHRAVWDALPFAERRNLVGAQSGASS